MQTDAVLALIQQVAAEVILPRFRALADHEVMEKSLGDLVTVADREAEVVLTRELLAAYPEALVVGEEATSADPRLLRALPAAAHAFTVDPVDGTKNFVHGRPDFGIMVAQLRSGRPVRSWIWQPVHERAYLAEQGAGAWCGPRRLTTRPAPADESRWRVATSAWGLRGRSFAALPPLVGTWVSCAVDYPHLVEGDADALLYSSSLPWDHLPGQLLLLEAGGSLQTLAGRDYTVSHTTGGLLAVADHAVRQRIRQALAGALSG